MVSAFKVRCMRSWRPFCCGLPGSISSGVTPSFTHHADNLDNLAKGVVANGTPLSERILPGKPYSLNKRVNHGFTPAVFVECKPWQQNK